MIQLSDIIGFVGTFLIIAAYLLLQTNRVVSSDIKYSVMNLTGALCILFSLYFKFNLAAFLVEIFWVAISLIGIVRFFRTNETAAN